MVNLYKFTFLYCITDLIICSIKKNIYNPENIAKALNK